MGIFSCILHRRILGTLAGRHKNSRDAISPALRPAARTGEGARRWWYSSRVSSIRTLSGAVRRGPAQKRPGNRETPGNIGWLWAGRVRVAPVVRPAAVSRRASQQPVARTGERARRRENPRVGCEAPYFRSGDRFQPFWALHAWGKSGPDREKRQCGRLRAFDSGAMAGFGLRNGAPTFRETSGAAANTWDRRSPPRFRSCFPPHSATMCPATSAKPGNSLSVSLATAAGGTPRSRSPAAPVRRVPGGRPGP